MTSTNFRMPKSFFREGISKGRTPAAALQRPPKCFDAKISLSLSLSLFQVGGRGSIQASTLRESTHPQLLPGMASPQRCSPEGSAIHELSKEVTPPLREGQQLFYLTHS